MRQPLNTLLKSLRACHESVEWATPYETDYELAWTECQRGDWMLWLLGKLNTGEPWSDARKPLVVCAMECALTVKHLWPQSKQKEIAQAVEVVLKWTNNEASVQETKEARKQLYAAAADAADAAAYAAYAAADAAAADAADAYAAADAAAADAADAAAADAADVGIKQLGTCADIVRKHYSVETVMQMLTQKGQVCLTR